MRVPLKLFLIILFISNNITASSFSVMTLNTQNLFDTYDDIGKDDCLGMTILDLCSVQEYKKFVNQWIPLEKCTSGEVLVSAEFNNCIVQRAKLYMCSFKSIQLKITHIALIYLKMRQLN